MATQRVDEHDRRRPLPTRDEVIARGRPFPAYEKMVIEDLTDEEEAAFLQAIADA